MKIALIADTHLPALLRSLDELGPETATALRGVDLILHAGDVTAPSVLDWLEQFAPVLAAQGNNDEFSDPRLAPVQIVDALGWRIGVRHDLAPETRPLRQICERAFATGVDVLVGGHTHLERLRAEDGLLLINPGSPILPHHRETRLGSLALLELSTMAIAARIIVLGETPGRPNPCTPAQLLHRREP